MLPLLPAMSCIALEVKLFPISAMGITQICIFMRAPSVRMMAVCAQNVLIDQKNYREARIVFIFLRLHEQEKSFVLARTFKTHQEFHADLLSGPPTTTFLKWRRKFVQI